MSKTHLARSIIWLLKSKFTRIKFYCWKICRFIELDHDISAAKLYFISKSHVPEFVSNTSQTGGLHVPGIVTYSGLAFARCIRWMLIPLPLGCMHDPLETLYLNKGWERQLDKQDTIAVVAYYQLYSVIPAFTLCCTRYDSIYTIHFAVVFVLSISLLRIYDIVSSLMLTIKVMQMSRIIFWCQ